MKFQTTRFGEIEIKDSSKDYVLEFSQGLFGFENLRKFILLNPEDETPFKWLQSLDEGDLAFILVQPAHFRANYELELSDRDCEDLEIKESCEALIYAIVTVPDDVSKMTANLQGPIVINGRNSKGKQVICASPNYHTRHEILAEMKELKELVKENSANSTDGSPEDKGGDSC